MVSGALAPICGGHIVALPIIGIVGGAGILSAISLYAEKAALFLLIISAAFCAFWLYITSAYLFPLCATNLFNFICVWMLIPCCQNKKSLVIHGYLNIPTTKKLIKIGF